jgi:hypothetical protein
MNKGGGGALFSAGVLANEKFTRLSEQILHFAHLIVTVVRDFDRADRTVPLIAPRIGY